MKLNILRENTQFSKIKGKGKVSSPYYRPQRPRGGVGV
jgi:hypothetical protein